MGTFTVKGDDSPGGTLRYWGRKTRQECAREILRCWQERDRLLDRIRYLEAGLEGIAGCAYGYKHPKAQTANEAAAWMHNEAMRLLEGKRDPS